MLDDIDLDTLSARPGVKWARATAANALAAWIADMDFPVAPQVQSALFAAVRTNLGYPAWDDQSQENPLVEAFVSRMANRYGYHPVPAHVRVFTEVIQGLQAILHVATEPGDAVAMHTPGYPPFLETLQHMNRRLVPIPMLDTPDGWVFDVDRLAASLSRHRCKALLLVNPHNPTGRVFTHAELSAIADLAHRHDLLIVADEILAELTYEPCRHLPIATLAPQRTVTLTSASKAFNLAGLRCAVADVAAPSVRRALDALPPLLLGQPGNLGVLGTLAAWQHGDPWLADVRSLLDRNRRLVTAALPCHSPEGTYLAWLDTRMLGPDPAGRILAETGVMLNDGSEFGPGGHGYTRLNFATSRPILDEILRRLSTITG